MDVVAGKVTGEVLPPVYGPIQSRRHGCSLGINVGLTEHKVCTWSCLYCQCGFGSRRDFTPDEKRIEVKTLLALITEAVKANANLDSLTLAGNTEPGTYPELLALIKGLIKLRVMSRARWKIVILSNGSELDRDEVVQAFNLADEAWLKLDAGTEHLFKTLNRPIARVGTLQDHVGRLKKIKHLRIQALIWDNAKDSALANAQPENCDGLVRIFSELKPKEVHLTTVARDPAFPGIVPVDVSVLNTLKSRIHEFTDSIQIF